MEQARPIRLTGSDAAKQRPKSSVIPPVERCAWSEDDCDSGWRCLHVPVPTLAAFNSGCCCYWMAGTEVTFLAPSFRGASTSTTLTAPGTTINTGTANSFNNFTYAPRMWIGKQGETWGFMTRFWYLSDSNAILNPILANGTNVGNGSIDRLKAYTFDAEAQRMFGQSDGARCFATFGARAASYSADSAYNSIAVLGPNVATAYSASSSRFNGVGLTSAFYGYQPIYSSDFSLFYNARGSVIFGNGGSQAATSASVQNATPGSALMAGGSIANQASTLYIGEIQVGSQWTHQFQSIPLNAFFRVVGEYQYWNANSPNATSASTAALGGTSAASAAFAGRTNLSFVGFAISTGCTW